MRVETFANKSKSCPVRAYKKSLSYWGQGKDWAVHLMTRRAGSVFTGRDFNKLLVPLSRGIVKPVGKKILSYSFRAAIPPLMAHAGYSDSEIMRLED